MSHTTERAYTTGSTSSQCFSQCKVSERPTSDVMVAHYPLGSWERHLLEERLRAVRRCEREQLLEEYNSKECTFQPRVSTSCGGLFASKDTFFSPGSKDEVRRQRPLPVFERLARRAKEREARLAKIAEEKRRREEEALQHSFRPQVNSFVNLTESVAAKFADIPVEERLLNYGRAVEESRRLLQQQREEKELNEIRQNVVSHCAHSGGSKDKRQGDIADRSKQLLIEREIQRVVAQNALLGEHTFRPKVCLTSDAIDRSLKTKREIHDRGVALYNAWMRKQQQQQIEAARRQGREFKDMYKPTTNPLTDNWIYHGQHRALFQKDFVKRQEIYRRVREEHQRSLASALEKSERASVPRVDQEMIERQVERLYLGAQEIRKETKKRTEENIKAQECPFRPQLAPGTAYVIAHTKREPDVVKRLSSVTRKRNISHQAAEDATAKREEEEEGSGKDDHCTRSPKVVGPEEAAEFYYKQKCALNEREMHLREQKQRQAMEELCACTFRPKTHTDDYLLRRQKETTDDAQRPITARVSGVSAYLQRQAEAKRRLKEKEEKYNSLGRGLSCNGTNSTVIKPFNLSSGRGPRNRSLSPGRGAFVPSALEARGEHHHNNRRHHNDRRGHHVDPHDCKDVPTVFGGWQA